MTEHTHRPPRVAGTPLNGIERASIKGAIRGVWRGRKSNTERALILPGVTLADALAIIDEIDAEECFVGCDFRVAPGPRIILGPREWRTESAEPSTSSAQRGSKWGM